MRETSKGSTDKLTEGQSVHILSISNEETTQCGIHIIVTVSKQVLHLFSLLNPFLNRIKSLMSSDYKKVK